MTEKTTCPHIEGSLEEHTRKEHGGKNAHAAISSLVTIFGIMIALLGGLWAIDNHYATAADVEQLKVNVESQFAQSRIDRIEDELFKLDAKKQAQNGKLDPVDTAMYERFLRRLQQVQQQSRALLAKSSL